ncbi:unnamed protein product [Phytomonas sp. EM1]|nr:unnamed protein product [Phytomonas sp. EM1]|eukprot:CCW62407.1 unnamed protein product [Phytomonas sp. isolate EM1]
MNEYQLLEEIGRGTLSRVYKGRKRNTIDFYAIHSVDKSMRQRVLNNVRILSALNHSNIIRVHEWYETVNHFWVITDLCISGDLRSILHINCKMKHESVRLLGSDVCAGLFHTHARGFLHRNLKPSGLLLNASAALVLHDFGLACPLQNAEEGGLIGTPPYIAPELFLLSPKQPPSIASDLWSLGCVLYEMASGEPPFKGRTLKELLTNVLTQPVNPIEGVDRDLNALIAHLLEKSPIRRASWGDVLSCGFWGDALEGLTLDALPVCSARKSSANGLGVQDIIPWAEADVRAAVKRAVEAAAANHSIASPASGGVDSPPDWDRPAQELNFTQGKSNGAAILDFPEVRCVGHGQEEEAESATITLPKSAASYGLVNSNHHVSNGNQSLSDARLMICHTDSTALTSQRVANSACEASKLSDFCTQNLLDEQSAEAIRRVPISDLIWFPSDANVRPLWGNRRIECAKEVTFKASDIPFRALELHAVGRLSERDFKSFMKCIHASLSCHDGTDEQKENILKYLATIVNGPMLSNRLVNSSIMALCVKMAGSRHLPVSCRMQASSLAGQLVRHASYIESNLVKTNILPQLLRYFPSEPNLTVKCKLVACIGELIYYIAAQKEHVCAEWAEIEDNAREVFTLALKTEDPLIRHYAVKAVENLSTNTERCAIFCTQRILDCLLVVHALGSSHNRHMRASALSAALRLSTVREELFPTLLASTELPINQYAELIAHPPTPRCGRVLLSFVNVVFYKSIISMGNSFEGGWVASSGSAVPLVSSIPPRQAADVVRSIASQKEEIIGCVVNRAGGGSDPIAAKLAVFMRLLGCLGGRVFAESCTASALALVDAVAGESDPHFRRCASAFAAFLGIYTSQTLCSLARGISRSTTPLYITSLRRIFSARTLLKLIPLRPDIFESLGGCLKKALSNAAYRPYEDDFHALAFYFVQQIETVVQHHSAILSSVAPHYLEELKKGESERRFTALYFLTSFMASLVSDLTEPRRMDTTLGKGVLRILSSVVDRLPELFLHADPIPRCALRLLHTCTDWNAAALSSVVSNHLLECMWNYLSCADDVDLFYPLHLLYAMLSHNDGKTDGVHFEFQQNHLTVLNRISVASMMSGFQHVLQACCKVIDWILRTIEMDAASYTDLQCAVFITGDAVERVFLPLCADESVSIHAAAITWNLARLCPSMYGVLLSDSGQCALQKALTNQLVSIEAVELLLRSFLYISEKKGKWELTHLANNKELMRALKKAIAREYPVAVYSYATQLYQTITDQQVLTLS